MRKFDRNDRVLLICFAVAVGMLGLSYASVPLYRIFCQATGFDGTPRIFSAPLDERRRPYNPSALRRQRRPRPAVGFPPRDACRRGPAWAKTLRPSTCARNTGNKPITGNARFNVTPLKAANILQQDASASASTVRNSKPASSRAWAFRFSSTRAIATDPETKDVTAITLSYTFFPAKSETKTIAAAIPR